MTYNAEQVAFMLHEAIDQNSEYKSWHVSTQHLMTLVERVVAEEREACAKIVEESSLPDAYSQECMPDIANDIRARGQV